MVEFRNLLAVVREVMRQGVVAECRNLPAVVREVRRQGMGGRIPEYSGS